MHFQAQCRYKVSKWIFVIFYLKRLLKVKTTNSNLEGLEDLVFVISQNNSLETTGVGSSCRAPGNSSFKVTVTCLGYLGIPRAWSVFVVGIIGRGSLCVNSSSCGFWTLLCVSMVWVQATERARVGTEGWQGSTSLAYIFCKPWCLLHQIDVTAAQSAPVWERTMMQRSLPDLFLTYKCCSNKRKGLMSGVWAKQWKI